MERAFKGVWIPKDIWLSKNLTLNEKVFLTEIDSLDNSEGCFASNEHFATFFNLSKNRCSEIIKSLEKKGYIDIKYIYKENSKEILKRIINIKNKRKCDKIPPSENRLPPSENRLTPSENRLPPSENWEDNNTINNTVNNTVNNTTTTSEGCCSSLNNNLDIFKHFEKCGFIINLMLMEQITSDIESYSKQWLMDAATEAMNRGKINNYKYVLGILQNWASNGRKEVNNNGSIEQNIKSSEDKPKYNFGCFE